MGTVARLNVDQILIAIGQLTDTEAVDLRRRLPRVLAAPGDSEEGRGWLYLAESAFDFWADPSENLYDDFAPINNSGSSDRSI